MKENNEASQVKQKQEVQKCSFLGKLQSIDVINRIVESISILTEALALQFTIGFVYSIKIYVSPDWHG